MIDGVQSVFVFCFSVFGAIKIKMHGMGMCAERVLSRRCEVMQDHPRWDKIHDRLCQSRSDETKKFGEIHTGVWCAGASARGTQK